MSSKPKSLRSKDQLRKTVTNNFLKLADTVVGKSGDIKTYGDFCNAIGFSQKNYADYTKGTRDVPFEYAVLACDVFGYNYNWMFAGKGDMLSKTPAAKEAGKLEERLERIEKMLNKKNK